MAVIKLRETYSVDRFRRQRRDALQWLGEEAIALQLVHVNDGLPQEPCPRCRDDVYQDGENDCPVCFGVSLLDPATGTGVRVAKRVWSLFTDHVVSEDQGQRGVWLPDTREVELEPFPMLTERDVVVRVPRWDTTTHTPLNEVKFYMVQAVTQNSLRTGGNQYSQTANDVIGQKAQCSLLSSSVGITNYPIVGVAFPDVPIVGSAAAPVPVAQPDTKVIYVPTPMSGTPAPGSGQVLGGILEWKAVYTIPQTVPARVWTVNHSLDHDPQVTVYVGGEIVLAQVDIVPPVFPATQSTQFTVTFRDPQVGQLEIS
jgi:hypothetical protein